MTEIDIRLIHSSVTEPSCSHLLQHPGQGRAFLLDRNWMVHMLIAKIFDCGCQMSKEDWNRHHEYIIVPSTEGFTYRRCFLQLLQQSRCLHRLRIGKSKKKDLKVLRVSLPTVPSSKPPFKQNFMLDVPEASVPAVEICWLISEAGINTSARETE